MNFVDRFTDWFHAVHWLHVAIAIAIAMLFLLFRKLCTKYVFTFLANRFHRRESLSSWTRAFEKPLSYGFALLGFYLAFAYALSTYWEHQLGIHLIFRSGIIILIGWGVYNVSASSSMLLEQLGKRFGLDESSMLIPFLSKLLRTVIVILILTIVGSEWGFSINGLVAGMGLGSLAIALAAKETLSNMFGGIVIIMEKPFSKGDWILTPSAEGIVEDITFRSTQIRTFANSVVTVPNSTIANQAITNWSKMGKRRISFTLKVALDSERDNLIEAIARMDTMLKSNDHVDPETILVRFDEFQEGSLGIFFYFFTKTTVWSEYLAIKQEINLEILRILEDEGVRLAYPVQRIFIESDRSLSNMSVS
ncbi:mechanosensitive ion channel family protein [Paenibacillus silvisoli]|uniref:mechanosensitive ion channel family protein n=1 Tax=Paenibacillus silvisoli TaxID=3110539 RepID=UPI002804C43D|nr:mechanosensitive ion channel family protein [Paenibacillus silvisoli]